VICRRACVGLPLACGLALVLAVPAPAQPPARGVSSEAYLERAIRTTGPARPDSIDARVEELLRRMTLEEKVGQMTQVDIGTISSGSGADSRVDPVRLAAAMAAYGPGSILNVAGGAYDVEQWSRVVEQIQDAARATRLGIPVLYGIDAVHGANYTLGAVLFPQNLGMAATWNPRLVEEAAALTAREVRASGIAWNFSPVLDVGRQPLWSRFYETFGEDPYLATVMGVAAVRGYQGDDVGRPDRVAATPKHFVGYSAPRSGRDRTPAHISERELREVFLPPFAAAVRAGAHAVMINSGEVNGLPVHADRHLLTDVLRCELGFKGLIVSDWEDIKKLVHVHRVAEDEKEATRMAILAGIDMSMVPTDFSFHPILVELVREGAIPESRIDESVRRILRLKYELGLFDDPYSRTGATLAGDQGARLALEAARESMTLLRNGGNILPLAADARVLVTGPTANSLEALNNGWSYTWQGRSDPYPVDHPTILDAIRRKVGDERVTHVPGTTLDREIDLAAVRAEAERADVVVVAVGEGAYAETPGGIPDLWLPEAQRNLIAAAVSTGTPVVLVLVEGRPRTLGDIGGVRAVLMAYNPGNQGGTAVADVLFGDVNPSGRLPFTYPRAPNDLVTYDHVHAERQDTNYGFDGFRPLFHFGEGLSYTRFDYTGLELSTRELAPGESLTVKVSVRNVGAIAGQEVVQLYLSDLVASATPPTRRLKRFAKVSLQPGEQRTLTFRLTPEDLSFVGPDGRWMLEPGEFVVTVGPGSESFTLRPGPATPPC
jgi:beta-glucosidase